MFFVPIKIKDTKVDGNTLSLSYPANDILWYSYPIKGFVMIWDTLYFWNWNAKKQVLLEC